MVNAPKCHHVRICAPCTRMWQQVLFSACRLSSNNVNHMICPGYTSWCTCDRRPKSPHTTSRGILASCGADISPILAPRRRPDAGTTSVTLASWRQAPARCHRISAHRWSRRLLLTSCQQESPPTRCWRDLWPLQDSSPARQSLCQSLISRSCSADLWRMTKPLGAWVAPRGFVILCSVISSR